MPGLKGVVQRMLGVQIGGVHTLALAGLALGEFLIDGGASLIGLGFAAGDLSIGAFFGICQNSLLFLLGLLDDLAGLAVCFNDAVYKLFHDIPPAMLYTI